MTFIKRPYLGISETPALVEALMERLKFVIAVNIKQTGGFFSEPTEKEVGVYIYKDQKWPLSELVKIESPRSGGRPSNVGCAFMFVHEGNYTIRVRGGFDARETLESIKLEGKIDFGKIAGVYDMIAPNGAKQASYERNTDKVDLDVDNLSTALEAFDKYYGKHLEGYAQQFGLVTRSVGGRQ